MEQNSLEKGAVNLSQHTEKNGFVAATKLGTTNKF